MARNGEHTADFAQSNGPTAIYEENSRSIEKNNGDTFRGHGFDLFTVPSPFGQVPLQFTSYESSETGRCLYGAMTSAHAGTFLLLSTIAFRIAALSLTCGHR